MNRQQKRRYEDLTDVTSYLEEESVAFLLRLSEELNTPQELDQDDSDKLQELWERHF